jgi:hypothetical protein
MPAIKRATPRDVRAAVSRSRTRLPLQLPPSVPPVRSREIPPGIERREGDPHPSILLHKDYLSFRWLPNRTPYTPDQPLIPDIPFGSLLRSSDLIEPRLVANIHDRDSFRRWLGNPAAQPFTLGWITWSRVKGVPAIFIKWDDHQTPACLIPSTREIHLLTLL